MIKPIIFIIFLLGSSLAFAETRLRLQFREIARISAILNQCETKEININRKKIDDFAKRSLILAKNENTFSSRLDQFGELMVPSHDPKELIGNTRRLNN